ncbi:MAG: YbaY family lipoprotein [Verrucomicrobia bacterium]|nr:YbaY family lipoprotein [Verrucomicrobiota bacterium]
MRTLPLPTALLTLSVLLLAGCHSKPPPPRLAITGTLNYDQVVVTPGCTIEVRLNDVSRADAPAFTLALERISPRESAPIPFTLHYDPLQVDPSHRYVVAARITCGDALVLVTDTAFPVLTQGHPSTVAVTLVAAGK